MLYFNRLDNILTKYYEIRPHNVEFYVIHIGS